MKKFTVILLLTTLIFANISVADAASDDYIKVGLKYGSDAPSSITISSDNGLALYTADSSQMSKLSSAVDGHNSVTLKNNGSNVSVTGSDGTELLTLSGDGTECISASSNEPVSVSGTSYRGGVIPYLNSSGRMNIINYVSTEDYLKGVIASEMYVSYEAEALKAQAVTARSFVLENVKKHASEGFSVCTTTHCQVYKGVSGENEKTSKAVDDTAGVLMYYNGSPVAGYYYANSGGHTENSEDVWSSYVGYLRGKADPYSPDDSWTVKLSKSQISDALSSRGLGDIKSVTIDSVNDSGYVASLTVTGSISSYTITKDSVRSVFGSSNRLKSRLFTIDTEGGTLTSGNSVTVPESGAMYVRTVNGTAKAGQNIYVASSSGTAYVPLNGLQVMNSAGSIKTADYTPAQTVSEGTGTTVIFNNDSDVLIINGKGSGHGVGMSQTGAQAMALQGYTYEDILKFYYTDIEVK